MGDFLNFINSAAGNIKLNYPRVFLFFLIPFFLVSCDKQQKTSAGYSDAFKGVFDVVTHYYDVNQPENAISYLDKSFPQIKEPTINDRFRFYSFHYVYWQKANRNYKMALPYADSMLLMSQKSATKEQYAANFAEANYAKGDTYFSLNQYNDAYQCYFQGYLMGKKYLNQASASDYTYRMGMIMFKQGHYKLAADYFKESYAKSLLVKDKHGFVWFYRQQELLDNIGESYTHNGELDSATTYFDKALKFVNDNGNKFKVKSLYIDIARGVIFNNKAAALMDLKQYAEAEKLLKKSIAINMQKGADNGDAVIAQLKLAQIYFVKRQDDSLLQLLGSLRGQLNIVKNEDAEADWNRLMGNYYRQKSNPSKALVYIQQYNSLKDSAIKKLSLLKESDVNQQLANFEKQYEIEGLNNNSKLQRIYLDVAIVCAVMLLAIIFLVGRNYRRSKHDVATVIMLNSQINEQKVNLEKALDELKYSSQEKDRILRAVAHDLRNPLGGIASLTSVMVEESEHDKDLSDQLKLIKETSTDTLELINEILEATNNSSATLKKQWVEVNALLNNSIDLLRFKAAEKHQQILLEGLDNMVELNINREKIWRVLSNLIVNAIKFSPVGEAIKVRAIQKHDNVIISVKDQGIGIPEKMKDKVFNMFTEAKRPGTLGEKSFGLGLSISKQIIEKHNGKIWFESEAGKGTTFYINLPKSVKTETFSPDSKTEQHMVLVHK
jgi:two-component system, OmpR family, sensor histidine kinase VicK